MADKTMISCLSWIRRGYAKETPITNAQIDQQMADMMGEEELMEEAKRYKEKFEDEDEEIIPNLVHESNMDEQMDEDKAPFAFDDSEDEKEDYHIKVEDSPFVAGKIEDEFAALEVQVYNEASGNLWVHHDIMLSSFPLC